MITDRIVGDSKAIVEMRALLQKIAASPGSTVLLTGESGTGKDLAAKVIHYASDRATQAVHEHHLLGAPRDAARKRAVRARAWRVYGRRSAEARACSRSADGGTVFLDEIGEMVPALQAKLLRFLEEKTFKRVGGSADIRVDVRVIAATNRDLEAEVHASRFRQMVWSNPPMQRLDCGSSRVP